MQTNKEPPDCRGSAAVLCSVPPLPPARSPARESPHEERCEQAEFFHRIQTKAPVRAINKSELLAREYDYRGRKGRFIVHRKTLSGCVLEGTAGAFFAIACEEPHKIEGRLSELAAKLSAARDRVFLDYESFVRKFDETLLKCDGHVRKKVVPELEEKGLISRVILELLRPCNLDCAHCYNTARRAPEESRNNAVIKKLDLLKQRLIKLGCVDLIVTGGEIGLIPGILWILKDLSRDFIVTALTNGTLWSDKDCEELAAARLKEIRTTLFSSDANVHDRITGLDGSWLKTYNFAMRLKRLNVPVRVTIPVLRANIAGIPALVEKLAASGLRAFVNVKYFRRAGPENCEASTSQLMDLFRSGTAKLHRARCAAIKNKVRVGPDGSIFPCEYLPVKIGNIFDAHTPEKPVICGPAARLLELIEKQPAGENCARCAAKDKCFTCIAFNHAHNGDYLKPSAYICSLNKLGTLLKV